MFWSPLRKRRATEDPSRVTLRRPSRKDLETFREEGGWWEEASEGSRGSVTEATQPEAGREMASAGRGKRRSARCLMASCVRCRMPRANHKSLADGGEGQIAFLVGSGGGAVGHVSL